MTIKEIAVLSGVSISTVSKIINGKDVTISQKTRKRVQEIVNECQYSPYRVAMGKEAPSRQLGLLLGDETAAATFIHTFTSVASKNGYSVVLCQHGGDVEKEYKLAARLGSQRVCGVAWERANPEQSQLASDELEHCKIPYLTLDPVPNPLSCGVDYDGLGFQAVSLLVQAGHRNLACVLSREDLPSQYFLKGCRRCLYENRLPPDQLLVNAVPTEQSLRELLFSGSTGIACFNLELASKVMKQAINSNLAIPQSISVVALGPPDVAALLSPVPTVVTPPLAQLAAAAAHRLMSNVAQKATELDLTMGTIFHGESVAEPLMVGRSQLVVVGSINRDILLSLDEPATVGRTVLATGSITLPGGKGANQAIGAARLGAKVHLIGKLGGDYDGRMLRECLTRESVDVTGISQDPVLGTGQAYVYVQGNGESSIVVYTGANASLCQDDIDQNNHLFHGAGYCLLQLETVPRLVEYAAATAVKSGTKVLLKPAATREISDRLLQHVDIFMPNERELDSLCNQDWTMEQKADWFLKRGASNVIVTRGAHGCYLHNHSQSLYFPSADFLPVDTTGAADAFAAALVVRLLDGYTLVEAIQYATYAAGLSVTRQGVQPSLVDKATMSMYERELKERIQPSTTPIY